MITAIIFILLSAIFIIAVYATDRTSENANGNILLGITLPLDKLKNDKVCIIVKLYHKAYSRFLLLFTSLIIPYMFFGKYLSVSIIYFTVWCALFLLLNRIILNKFTGMLYSLKQESKWWVGTPNIINIDTEVSRLKNTFPISKLWFLLPFFISFIPILHLFFGKGQQELLSILSLCGIIVVSVCFIVNVNYSRSRTTVYSQNVNVNIALNCAQKREWSKCYFLISFAGSIISLTLPVVPLYLDNLDIFVVAFIVITGIYILFPILYTYCKIKEQKNFLLQIDSEIIYADEDIYWKNGFYNNPHDTRTTVEKRTGIGTTFNIATKSGRNTLICVFISIFLCITIALGIGVVFIPLDFGSIAIAVSNGVVTINAPIYEYAFPINDIINITMVDDIPNGTRTNGASTDKFNVGHFNLSEYGQSRLYVYNNPPYISIELENGWLFLNGETQEQTEAYYEALNER